MAVQNKQLNPEEPNIIQNIIHKLQEWFGKSRLDLLSVAWREINLVKKGSDEKLDVFMNRFDAAYLKLKCSVSGLPDEILTIMFLDGMNLDNIQKQNIVSKVKLPVPATSCLTPKIDTDKQTDLVLEVTPPEALESDKN